MQKLKKLQLVAMELSDAEVLNRSQLKNVVGGSNYCPEGVERCGAYFGCCTTGTCQPKVYGGGYFCLGL